MNSRTQIQSELKELNSSLPFNVQMPVFDVPQDYFESFADSVLAKVKGKQAVSSSDELDEIAPFLASIPRKMPFSVPDNYFQSSTVNIPELVQDDYLPEFLSGVNKSMPYNVPAGYFESLPQQVLNKVVSPKTSAKVISFNRNWMRYAVAAVLIGIVAISSILYFSGSSKTDTSVQSEAWIAKKLKNVSTKELEDFISTASAINGTEMAQNNPKGKYEVEKMLQDVSDNELDAFLEQLPSGNSNGDDLLIN